jgi:hypothetical protein
MQEGELEWLAQQAAQHKVIVEIGSYLGRSTRAMADNTNGIVYAVDDWKGPRDIEIPAEERERLFDRFMENMDGLQGRLQVIKQDHANATVDCSPDMVFIDGDHDYENVVRDIKRWLPRLAPGGLICGHDAFDEDVSRAFKEVLGEDTPVVQFTTIWYRETSPHPMKHIPYASLKEPKIRTATLSICIPFSGRFVAPEWAMSLATLSVPMNTNYSYFTVKGMKRDAARNYLCERALNVAAKYILFLDDDTAPPSHAVHELLYGIENADDDVAFCGGIYCTKTCPATPIVSKDIGDGPFWKWKTGEIFEAKVVGTGCMLIKASALEKIPKPWFKDISSIKEAKEAGFPVQEDSSVLSNQFHMTDDVYFSNKVYDAGMRGMAHGGVLPVHFDDRGNPYVLPEDSYPVRHGSVSPYQGFGFALVRAKDMKKDVAINEKSEIQVH